MSVDDYSLIFDPNFDIRPVYYLTNSKYEAYYTSSILMIFIGLFFIFELLDFFLSFIDFGDLNFDNFNVLLY